MNEPQAAVVNETEHQPKKLPLRKISSVLFKVVLCFLVGLFLLITGLSLYLNTESARNLILRYVNGNIPGELDFDPIRLSLINGQIELNRVSLKSPDRTETAAFDQLFIEISWRGLLQQSLSIDTILLKKPTLNLIIDENGDLNILKAFPPAAERDKPVEKREKTDGFPFGIAVKEIKLIGGKVRFQHVIENAAFSAEGINITADAFIPAMTGNLDIALQDINISHPELNYRAAGLQLSGSIHQKQLDPVTLRLESDPLFVLMTASADMRNMPPTVDIKLESRLNLDQAGRTLAGKDREADGTVSLLSGDLTLNASVQGDLSNPQAALTIDFGGGSLDIISLGPTTLDFMLTDRQAEIRKLTSAAGGGSLEASARINLQSLFPHSFFQPPADIKNITYDFHVKGDSIKLPELIRLDQPLTGVVSFSAAANGTGIFGDQSEADTLIFVKAHDLSFGHEVPAISLEMNAQAGMTGRTAALNQFDLKLGGIKLAAYGSYAVETKQAKAHLHLTAPDLASSLQSIGITGPVGENVDINLNLVGDILQPIADLQIKVENGGYEQIRAGNIKLNAALSADGNVIVKELAVRNQGTIIDGHGWINLFDNGFALNSALPTDITLNLDNFDLADFMPDIGIAGKISGKISAQGEHGLFDAAVSLNGIGMKTQPIIIGDVIVEAALNKGRVFIHDLNIRNQETLIGLQGWIDLLSEDSMTIQDDPAFYLTLNADPFILDNLKDQIRGKVFLQATAHGTFQQPLAEALIRGEHLQFISPETLINAGKIEVSAGLNEHGEVIINNLSLHNKSTRFSAQGRVAVFTQDFPLEINAEFENLAYTDFLTVPDIKGQLSGALHLSGDIKQPCLKFSASGQNLAYTDYQIGNIQLEALLEAGRIMISQLELKNRTSSLSLNGQVQLFEPDSFELLPQPELDCRILIPSADLSHFAPNLKGICSLKADLQGTPLNPRGNIELIVKKLDFSATGVQAINRIELKARSNGESLFIEPLSLYLSQQESLKAEGIIAFDQTFDLKLTADAVHFHEIVSLTEILEQHGMGGKVRLTVTGRGDFSNPELSGSIALSELTYQQQSLDDIFLDVTLKDKKVQAEIRQNFTIASQYNIENHDFSAKAELKAMKLDPLLGIAGLDQFTGILTAEVSASGRADDLNTIKVQAHVADLDFNLNDTQLIKSNNIRVLFDQGDFSIPAASLSLLSEGHIEATGSGRLDGNINLNDFSLKGVIPFHTASLFVEDLEDLSGNLRLDIKASGTLDSPVIDANIDIEQFSMIVPGIYQRLHSVKGKIKAGEKKVEIVGLEGNLDSGRFNLSGDLLLDKFTPGAIRLKLNANALPINIPDMLDLVLNADVTLTGDSEHTRLNGDVILVEGLYYKDVNLNMAILKGVTSAAGRPRRQTAPSPSAITSPYIKNMDFNILIKRRNPLLVDNDLAQLEISPDLHLTGKLQQPIISGRATIDYGSITYHKKMFDVKKGVIDFLNPYAIEPTIDLESELRIRDWDIVLKVSGTPDKLVFHLSSKPPEEHGDILSLLLLDKTTRELIEGEGGNPQSTNQMLANLIASTIGADFKKATGLDIFEVETNGADESSERVTVTLGKQLSRRITLKYAIESTEGETVQRAITEYKFLENVIINGFQDSKGIFGGEIQYRIEFR